MTLTVEYVDSLLSQIEFMTKELKDNQSDNVSLHRQLDHWQVISIHWMNERNTLAQERDALVADAARYRFITTHIVDEGDMDVLERAFESMFGAETCTVAEFNACIDAAIVKEQRQAGIK